MMMILNFMIIWNSKFHNTTGYCLLYANDINGFRQQLSLDIPIKITDQKQMNFLDSVLMFP